MDREIRELVALQRKLLSAFWKQTGSLENDLANVPSHGSVTSNDKAWEFMRHGSGVRFRNTENGIVVDVHACVDDPGVFDHWRLRIYLGSLGRRGVKCIERASGQSGISMDAGIDSVLAYMVEQGTLQRDGKQYRLSAD